VVAGLHFGYIVIRIRIFLFKWFFKKWL